MLELEDRQTLVAIVAGLYDFTDGGLRGRRLLLEQAGLSSFVSGIDLLGAPKVVAQDIIGRLDGKGYLGLDRANYHALGALLSYILKFPDLPEDQKRVIAWLIVRYSLVLDPAYIADLRNKYIILDAPVQSPTPVPVLPPPRVYQESTIPDFNVTIPDEEGLERVITSEDNFLDIYLLAGAIYSAQAVCQIERRGGGAVKEKAIGTGFLIGPDLLLTNQHVVEDQRYLPELVAHFGYRIDANGVPLYGRTFDFRPDFYFSSSPLSLDYALLRLKDQPLKAMAPQEKIEGLSYLELLLQGKHRGYLLLAERSMREKERINIIQHPDGQAMKVVLTQNYVAKDMSDSRLQYIADTMDGSSGSPVFNQDWEVIALHHSGKPYPPDAIETIVKKVWKRRFRVNEGIPIRAILKDFRENGLDRYLPRI